MFEEFDFNGEGVLDIEHIRRVRFFFGGERRGFLIIDSFRF